MAFKVKHSGIHKVPPPARGALKVKHSGNYECRKEVEKGKQNKNGKEKCYWVTFKVKFLDLGRFQLVFEKN